MARDLQNIRTLKDFNSETWAKIFSHHLGRKVRLVDPAQATDFKAIDGNNDFFNSDIVKIKLDFVDDEKKQGKERDNENQIITFHLVIKNPAESPFARKISKFIRPFMSEIFFHTKASQAFPEISDLLPICYFGSSTYDDQLFHRSACERHCCFLNWCCCRKEERGVLVMEDLTVNSSEGKQQNGFKLIDKTKVPSVDHVKLVLQSLARYHGTWLVFLNGGKERSDVPFTPEEIRTAFLQDLGGFVLKPFVKPFRDMLKSIMILMKNRGEDEAFIHRVKKYADEASIPKITNLFRMNVKGTFKLQTMLHGDLWSNNFMFREDDQGKPLDVKLLDFQFCYLGHPAADILFFLYINTDAAFRKAHLAECLHEYFDRLHVFLKRVDIEMEFEDFMQEFNDMRDHAIIGLGNMIMVLSPIQADLRTLRQFYDMSRKVYLEISSPDKPDDHPNILEIRRRLLEAMREFDELGLLI